MIKGGYKVIDLKDIPLSTIPCSVSGIYNRISKSYEKPIMISNLNIDGVQYQDYYTQPIKTAGGAFTMTVGDYTLTITSTDGVSVAEGIIGGGGSGQTYTAGENIQIQNGVISATDTKYSAGNNIQISEENVISATDTTYSAMTGATASSAGTSGLVPAPAAGDQDKALCGDGTYKTISASSGPVIKISGTINSTSSYSGFNRNAIGNGTVSSNNHNIVFNCGVDLKPLITTSQYNENVLTVPVEGYIFPGTSSYNSCYASGTAYIWETSTQYKIYVTVIATRGISAINQLIIQESINKSGMSDPTKLILSNYKPGSSIQYITLGPDLGLDDGEISLSEIMDIYSQTSATGYLNTMFVGDIANAVNSYDMLFVTSMTIDNVNFNSGQKVSAYGHVSSEYVDDEELHTIVIFFLGFKLTIEPNPQYESESDRYVYTVAPY